MTAGRTKTRFLLVVALLSIPSFCFGGLFIANSQKAITFARQEIAGIQYLRSIVPLFLTVGQSGTPRGQSALSQFETMREEVDERFSSAPLSQAVVNALKQKPINSDAVRYALLSLINGVSDTSNLTIDPELDSFYLMQAMVFQMPRLMSSIDALAARMAAVQPLPEELSQRATFIFVDTVRLEDAASDLRRDYTRALASNEDGSLERKLSTVVEATMRAVHKMSISGHRLRAALLSDSAVDISLIPSDGISEKTVVIHAWTAMGENLERLVRRRIDTLEGKRDLALTFSSIAGVIVFFMGLGVFRSLLVELDERILFLAHHDAMTQLKNRVSFSGAVGAAIAKHGETGSGFAIHAIDLDGFKAINDTFGHPTGDEVLQIVAERLLALAGPDDVVGRRGGDEFVVLQATDTNDSVEHFARRIVDALHAPMPLVSKSLAISASVGSCIFGRHGDTEALLMQSADLALYAAKGGGKDRACIFDEIMLTEQRCRYDLEARVRTAVKDAQFSLAYQPQYDQKGQQITGFEALLRLNEADGKPIPPVLFIPVLERLFLIGEIGQWVLQQACATANEWPADIVVAVNVSPLQFETGQLLDGIVLALAESGLPPGRLQLEITERPYVRLRA